MLGQISIEAKLGTPLPPKLHCPAIVVSGHDTKVVLRHLTIVGTSGGAVVELRQGAQCELLNCRLHKGLER